MRVVLAALLAATPAFAETQRPETLQALLDYHTTACEIMGGSLTIGATALTEAELNGDGQPDVLLDSRQLDCSASPAMFCVAETGCELNIFVGAEQHTIIALDWVLEDAGDRQYLVATIKGHLLQRPDDVTARMTWDDAAKGLKLIEYVK
jgi:hypothetical protein